MNLADLKNKKLIDILHVYNVNLKRSGNKYKAFCPLHDDRHTPNFFYFPETDSFYCFSCHKGGGALDFIAYKENMNKKDILKLWNENIKLDIKINKKDFDYKKLSYMMLTLIARTLVKKDKIQELKKYDEMFNSANNYKNLYHNYIEEFHGLTETYKK